MTLGVRVCVLAALLLALGCVRTPKEPEPTFLRVGLEDPYFSTDAHALMRDPEPPPETFVGTGLELRVVSGRVDIRLTDGAWVHLPTPEEYGSLPAPLGKLLLAQPAIVATAAFARLPDSLKRAIEAGDPAAKKIAGHIAAQRLLALRSSNGSWLRIAPYPNATIYLRNLAEGRLTTQPATTQPSGKRNSGAMKIKPTLGEADKE